MLKIREIQIKNFRSIVNETIKTIDMNVFVGLNDVGKSNVLKALNLFFNAETEIGHPLKFELDYSKLAPYRVNKAKEISIAIEIEVPAHYSDGGLIIWKKVWRSYKNEPHMNEQFPKSGEKFSERSKVPTALNRIIYKYIPAIKSDDYFKHLLGDLYQSASIQIMDEIISGPAKAYSDSLETFTKRISEIVKEKIGIDSILTLPENQMDIFKELTFGTKDSLLNDILLDYRGDGIKARHIPAILKFIEEMTAEGNRGAVPYSTIWGYEEPENGIEMLKCFDLATEFYTYKDNIQLFLSTHSPAFYSHLNEAGVKVFSVQKSNESAETKITDKIEIGKINESIGILPLITPHVKEQVEKIKNYQTILNDNFLIDVDTIMVEGQTDRDYFQKAIEVLSPKLHERLSNQSLRILTRIGSCGTTVLRDWTLAWCLSPYQSKFCVLFDNDSAGMLAITQIKDSEIYKKCNHKPVIKKILPNTVLKSLFGAGLVFPFSVEHLFPIEIWKNAKECELLIRKDFSDYAEMNVDFRPDLPIFDKINELIEDDMIKDTIIHCKFVKEATVKTSFKNLVDSSDWSNDVLYSGFVPTIEYLESKFC